MSISNNFYNQEINQTTFTRPHPTLGQGWENPSPGRLPGSNSGVTPAPDDSRLPIEYTYVINIYILCNMYAYEMLMLYKCV